MGQLIGLISDSTKEADVKIETEKSGMIAWRIIGGKILASLHFDMKPTSLILNTVYSMFSVESNALNWRYPSSLGRQFCLTSSRYAQL